MSAVCMPHNSHISYTVGTSCTEKVVFTATCAQVFVGGMPYSCNEAAIREYWGWCGEIESLDMLTFPDTGRFRGIAFITFATEEGYTKALAYDGEQVDGQTLRVSTGRRFGCALYCSTRSLPSK